MPAAAEGLKDLTKAPLRFFPMALSPSFYRQWPLFRWISVPLKLRLASMRPDFPQVVHSACLALYPEYGTMFFRNMELLYITIPYCDNFISNNI
jgi:hypothetical protein